MSEMTQFLLVMPLVGMVVMYFEITKLTRRIRNLEDTVAQVCVQFIRTHGASVVIMDGDDTDVRQ